MPMVRQGASGQEGQEDASTQGTQAVGQLVADVAPALARIAEAALAPAASPSASSLAVDASGKSVPMPELANDIENLGVVTEAAAEEGGDLDVGAALHSRLSDRLSGSTFGTAVV